MKQSWSPICWKTIFNRTLVKHVRWSTTFQNYIPVCFPVTITIMNSNAVLLKQDERDWHTSGGWVYTRTKGAKIRRFDEIVTCHQSLGMRGLNSWVGTHKIMDVWEVFGSIGGHFVQFSVKDEIHSTKPTHARSGHRQPGFLSLS